MNKDKKELIWNFINDKTYVPMKKKEMAQVLMVPKEELQELQSVLEELEREYKIRKNRKNQYIIMDEPYVQGVYHRHQKGFGFVILENEEEIHIASTQAGSALDGDVVLVKILEETSNQKKEGKIVKILKREIRELVGTFKNSKNFGFVVPDNPKLGTDIFISKKKFKGARNQDKVVVKIIKYPEKRKKCRRGNCRNHWKNQSSRSRHDVLGKRIPFAI